MTHPSALILASFITCSSMALLAGCSDAAPSSGEAPQSLPDAGHDEHDGHDHSGHDHSGHDHAHDSTPANTTPDIYTGILGEITMIPVEGDPSSALKIRHQQIPNFKNKDGEITVSSSGIAGMSSMTMEFPLGQGMNLDGFNIGDKVSFTFQVNWGGSRVAWEVTQIGKIDPSTVIDYTNTVTQTTEDHTGHDHDHDGHEGP